MSLGKKILLIVGILVLLLGTGVAVFGGTAARRLAPELFVARMIRQLGADFLPENTTPLEFAEIFLRGEYSAQFTAGLVSVRGEAAEFITPEIMGAVQLLRLRNTTTFDSARESISSETVLQMAVSPLLSLQTNLERDLISARVPQLFDYYIGLEPASVYEDWNNSIFAAGADMPLVYLNIDNARFYEYYSRLFEVFADGFWDGLDFDINTRHLWREGNVHAYLVTLTSPAHIFELYFEEESGRFSRLVFSEAMPEPETALMLNLEYMGDSRYSFLSGARSEAFSVVIEGTASGYSQINANITISENPLAYVEMRIPEDFEAVINVDFSLLPEPGPPQEPDRADVRHISEINAVDIIAIAARLRGLPFADMLLG